MQSKIIISNNPSKIKDELLNQKNVQIFEFPSLLLEHAKEIINEAYIASYEIKNIIIIAQNFRIEAQNALLKILEEPPQNVIFTIIIPAKNALLPTIKSRLMVQNRLEKSKRVQHGLDFTKLDLKSAYEFIQKQEELKNSHKISAVELSNLVNSIVCDCIDAKIPFSKKELEYFYKLSFISSLNTPANAVLTPLLLLILEKFNKK